MNTRRDADHVSFVPPILRKEIIEATPSQGNHIVVYQTTQTNKKLIPALQGCPNEQFIYYWSNEDRQDKNICYKKFSTAEFIADLASAKAIITNGGFTLISEAIFLHKPLLCNPVENHYEQYLNSEMVAKLGYGISTNTFCDFEIQKFIDHLDEYQKNLQQYHQVGNEKLFELIDILLKKIEQSPK